MLVDIYYKLLASYFDQNQLGIQAVQIDDDLSAAAVGAVVETVLAGQLYEVRTVDFAGYEMKCESFERSVIAEPLLLFQEFPSPLPAADLSTVGCS